MKFRTIAFIAICLLVALVQPLPLAAQQPGYKLVDIGTFGGPVSDVLSA